MPDAAVTAISSPAAKEGVRSLPAVFRILQGGIRIWLAFSGGSQVALSMLRPAPSSQLLVCKEGSRAWRRGSPDGPRLRPLPWGHAVVVAHPGA